jgi:hypothetical protein
MNGRFLTRRYAAVRNDSCGRVERADCYLPDQALLTACGLVSNVAGDCRKRVFDLRPYHYMNFVRENDRCGVVVYLGW